MMEKQRGAEIARTEQNIRVARARWHRSPSRMNGDRLLALLSYRRNLEEA